MAIDIDVDEALQLLTAGAFLLDVREEGEWALGRAAGAYHIPLHEVPDRTQELPLDTVVVCICRSGARSARAADYLAELGFTTRNLAGGTQAWYLAGAAMSRDGTGEPEVA
jgi:rhodanese-related sulfurtransferase